MTTLEATQELVQDIKKRVKVELRVITPVWAKSKLKMNDTEDCPNRNISRQRLAAMKKDLLEGRWNQEGWDCIAFDSDGNLINGQHRLSLVVETGKPIISFVMTGLCNPTREVADTGKIRDFADVLKMRGVANYVKAATITRMVAVYKNGNFFRGGGASTIFTNAYLSDLLAENPKIEEAARWYASNKYKLAILGCAAAIATIRYLVLAKHEGTQVEQVAHKFFDALATGEMSKVGDPALALRNRLISLRLADTDAPRGMLRALIIHAWNSAKAGKKISSIRKCDIPVEIA